MLAEFGAGGVVSDRTLGALIQTYVADQCVVVLGAVGPLRAHDDAVVHPTRVAVRRLRATLRTFPRVYRRKRAARLADDLRWFGDALGRVRDLHIVEERVRASLEGSAARDASAVPDRLARRIASDRAAAWQAVDEATADPRFGHFLSDIGRWRDDPPFGGARNDPAAASRPAVDRAARLLRRRLRHAARAIEDGDPDAAVDVHAARKAAKRHRYALEAASPLLGTDADAMHGRLRALQDALGERQDAAVTLAWLGTLGSDAESSEAIQVAARAQRDVLAETAAIVAAALDHD